jgi:hypothetical protein
LGCIVWVTGTVAKITNRGLGLAIYVPSKLQGKLEPLKGRRVLVIVLADECVTPSPHPREA